ncbi:MAG: hypothetical protein PF501_16335 [Salinisphaera sp.]|jgi:hypothetical protein|nr:hypothetical protein [Salinisphaera sp.]
MKSSNIRVPFQRSRRRGDGDRLFLPLRLQIAEYLLRFSDGTHERYQVAYNASIEAEKSRQRWQYRGHVSRQLSLYNRAGERFGKVDGDRRIELIPEAGHNTMADWHGWRECVLEPGPSLPEDEFEKIIGWLSRASAASVIADKRRLERDFRRVYKCLESISEID